MELNTKRIKSPFNCLLDGILEGIYKTLLRENIEDICKLRCIYLIMVHIIQMIYKIRSYAYTYWTHNWGESIVTTTSRFDRTID